MTKHLFVYGTLHPRKAPPEVAASVSRMRKVARGHLRGKVYDLGEYPGAVWMPRPLAKSTVKGTIFQVPADDPHFFSTLDRYEGYDPSNIPGSLFKRTRRIVTVDNGKRMLCWVYEYNQALKDTKKLVGAASSQANSRAHQRIARRAS